MSSNTTTQTQTRTRHTVLRDYELHHSSSSSRHGSSIPAQAIPPTAQASSVNPPNWDTTHRRVPPYRPINRDRDQSEVRVYTSTPERVFVAVMFTGVLVNATAAKIWRGTVGRVNDGVFKYPVGGEI